MFISKQNISRLVLLLILGVAAWYIIAHREDFDAIRHINPSFLWPILLCVIVQHGVNGYMNKEFVRYFNVDLDINEWFGLALVSNMGNYLAPFRGGMAGRAVYLKKKHRLPYTRFMTLFIASYLLIFFFGGLLGALTMTGIFLTQGLFQWKLFVFFITLSAAVILFIVVFSRVRLPEGKKWGRISEAITGWKIISSNIDILWRICGAVIINYLLGAIQIYYGFISFGFAISPLAAWIVGLFSAFGLLLSITPGNLGIQETWVGFLSAFLGIGFNQGVMAQGLIRAVNMLVIFTLGPLYSYILTRKFSSE